MIIHLSQLCVAFVVEILEYDDELFKPEVNALFPMDRVTSLRKKKPSGKCTILIPGLFLDLLLNQFTSIRFLVRFV